MSEKKRWCVDWGSILNQHNAWLESRRWWEILGEMGLSHGSFWSHGIPIQENICARPHQKVGAWGIPCDFDMKDEWHTLLWARGCPWAHRLYLTCVLVCKTICRPTSPETPRMRIVNESTWSKAVFLLSWNPRPPCQMKLLKVNIQESEPLYTAETQRGEGEYADEAD